MSLDSPDRNTIEALLRLVESSRARIQRHQPHPIDVPGRRGRIDLPDGYFQIIQRRQQLLVRGVMIFDRDLPELIGRKVARDEIQSAEMILIGMTEREPIDVHDFLRPQISRDHPLAEVEVAPRAAAVDHHHARAGKRTTAASPSPTERNVTRKFAAVDSARRTTTSRQR